MLFRSPEPIACLHPKELKKQGLQAGDEVTLTTRRGSITLRVREDRDVAVGMVFVPFCFNEAAANVLTNPQLDPFGKIPEFKFAAVRLEPVKEAIAAE